MDRKDLVIGSQANLNSYLYNELENLRKELKIVREELVFLRKENANLRAENELMKAVFSGRVRRNEPRYRELEKSFNRLERSVFKAVKHACNVHRRPVMNDEIIKCFFSKYPFLKGDVKTETVTRRVRRLKEKGFLVSPNRGFYCPKMEVNES